MGSNAITIELTNDLAELERLATTLADFGTHCALPTRLVNEINLVLEELVTNIISYGFDGDESRIIHVDVALTEQGIVTRVEDDGRAFDPTQAPTPDVTAEIDDREIGGLGILLVKELMDEVVYWRLGDRNVLLMTKYAAAQA